MSCRVSGMVEIYRKEVYRYMSGYVFQLLFKEGYLYLSGLNSIVVSEYCVTTKIGIGLLFRSGEFQVYSYSTRPGGNVKSATKWTPDMILLIGRSATGAKA